jgi:hypothetical protein
MSVLVELAKPFNERYAAGSELKALFSRWTIRN